MTKKQLFIQKMSILLKEKNDRIRIVVIGQEAIEIFNNAHTNYTEGKPVNLLIHDLSRQLLEYAHNPKQEKEIMNSLTHMSNLIND